MALPPPNPVAYPVLKGSVLEYVANARSHGQQPVLRRSLVEAFLSCAAYVPGLGPNAAYGQLVHEAIASYWQSCYEANVDQLPDPEQFVRWAWKRTPRGLHAGRLDDALALMQDFARTHLADPRSMLRLEYTFTWVVGDLLLTGTCDRLDRADGGDRDDPPEAVRLVDYKTELGGPDHAFQMRWYGALACLELPTVQEVETEIDLVAAPRTPRIARYTREQLLAWFYEQLDVLTYRLSSVAARPTGGSACTWCARRLRCAEVMPPWGEVPEDDAQAAELAGEWIRAGAREAELAAILKAYTDGRPDALHVDGKEIGWLRPRFPSFKAQLPPRQVDETLHAYMKRLHGELHKAGLDTVPLSVVLGTKLTAAGKRALLAAGMGTEDYGPTVFKARNAAGGEE